MGKRLPRRQLQGFDYAGQAPKLEIPIQERIAAIRARKQEERTRARAKADAKAARGAAPVSRGKAAGGAEPVAAATASAASDAGHRPGHAGSAGSRATHEGAPGSRAVARPERSGHPERAPVQPRWRGPVGGASASGMNPWPGRGRADARRTTRRPGR